VVSQTLNIIIQYGSNCILGIMKVWRFLPKMSSKNQPHISVSIVWQYWLGVAKPKNVLKLTLRPSNKLL